jgi:hypothetical protein
MWLEPAVIWKVADAETVPDEVVRAGEARRILVVIFGALVAQQAFLSFLALLLHRDLDYWPGGLFGVDFRDFFTAARDIVTGAPPYARDRFFTPPVSGLVALPFLPFGPSAAPYAFFIANLAMVLTALALTARRFSLRSPTEIALLAGIFGLYCPSYFLLQRGNLDGVVMLCVALAIWSVGRAWASAFVILGASIKIYPAVLLAWFATARRWRALWVAGLMALICVAVVWPLWPAFSHSIVSRSARWEVAENSSLFNFAIGLTSVLRLPRACGLVLAAAAALGFFALQALADRRAPVQSTRAQAARLALYIPFFAGRTCGGLSLHSGVVPDAAAGVLVDGQDRHRVAVRSTWLRDRLPADSDTSERVDEPHRTCRLRPAPRNRNAARADGLHRSQARVGAASGARPIRPRGRLLF